MSSNLNASNKPVRVVALGAICDVVASTDAGRTTHFSVGEFAELEDGVRVSLHDDRGFTSSWRGAEEEGASEEWHTDESTLRANVLTVVLPDEDDGEEHPWDWLARLARARELDVTADDLRGLPYNVVLAPAVLALTRLRRVGG